MNITVRSIAGSLNAILRNSLNQREEAATTLDDLHLGILQTDSVLEDLQPRFEIIQSMLEQLFRAEDPTLTVTTYDVQRALPEALVCDAYLITGCSRAFTMTCLGFAILPFVGRAMANKRKFSVSVLATNSSHIFSGGMWPRPGWVGLWGCKPVI